MADTKQQWYKDAKYGLFIHWGLYSILAGEWKDPKTGEVTKTDRIAEWIENNLNIDKEDSVKGCICGKHRRKASVPRIKVLRRKLDDRGRASGEASGGKELLCMPGA